MSKNIVIEGWLTKSPPNKRVVWKTVSKGHKIKKWRRRWFALRQSGELPGQYLLDYYADRNYRRPKGTINLDLCEQVDAGLHERTGNGTLDPKVPGSVFTIWTQSRTYHLKADCEADMVKWVDAICRVCGLRASDGTPNDLGIYQNSLSTINRLNEVEGAGGTGPYIPISECVTGVRPQDQKAFTFDPKNIVMSTTRSPFVDHRNHHLYMSHPHIRSNNADLSEYESNLSDDECKSLNTSQSNIGDWSVAKSFTKLALSSERNGFSGDGPPVPPRPPKTFAMSKDILQKEAYQGPKIQEPLECNDNVIAMSPRRLSHGATPPSPARPLLPAHRTTDDEDECGPSLQYCNMPPAVDRALKPRSSHSIGRLGSFIGQADQLHNEDMSSNVLQYLDLDLQPSKPPPSRHQQVRAPRKKLEIHHDKSKSDVDTHSAYKTVDFLMTEAFNITRQDAEASRSHPH